MKNRRTYYYTALSAAVIALLSFSSCIETTVDIEEIFKDRGREWTIVGHCSEFEQHPSKIQFNPDGGGLYLLYRDCEMGGTECTYSNLFDWEADDENGQIHITWRTGTSAVLVCSESPDASYQTPVPESFNFSESTENIVVRGYTWEND